MIPGLDRGLISRVWFPKAVTDRAVRVAAVSHAPVPDARDAVALVAHHVRESAEHGAMWVAFPEGTMHEYRPGDPTFVARAESLNGPFVSAMVDLANSQGVVISAGVWEAGAPGELPFNTHVVVSGDGVLAAYRKVHLFDALGHHESRDMQAGATEAVTLPWHGFTIGLLTCYDIRFPEQARALVDAGADVLLVAAAWARGPGKRRQWETLLAARAIENTTYVVAAGLVSAEHDGPSMVIDPVGDVVARWDAQSSACIVGDLSRMHLDRVRDGMPSLRHRRWSIAADPA